MLGTIGSNHRRHKKKEGERKGGGGGKEEAGREAEGQLYSLHHLPLARIIWHISEPRVK